MTFSDTQRKFDAAAAWYDVLVQGLEWILLRRLRRELTAGIIGPVLDVASGPGQFWPLLPPHSVGVDASLRMLLRARSHLKLPAAVMDAQCLAFRDGQFATVVSSLATCTFSDPVAALREMARVCRPGGRVLLLEHGRATGRRMAGFQDRYAEWHARQLGCHWNREPLELVRDAGLRVVRSRRLWRGIIYVIEAAV